ncbi:proline-rich protein 2-like [Aphelocoma coerulescens]|uniref:proline-rich protein 2-like n=1 Tax=Aphelocoma coerulescens TaxID=39617 RepID=UPI0036049DAD
MIWQPPSSFQKLTPSFGNKCPCPKHGFPDLSQPSPCYGRPPRKSPLRRREQRFPAPRAPCSLRWAPRDSRFSKETPSSGASPSQACSRAPAVPAAAGTLPAAGVTRSAPVASSRPVPAESRRLPRLLPRRPRGWDAAPRGPTPPPPPARPPRPPPPARPHLAGRRGPGARSAARRRAGTCQPRAGQATATAPAPAGPRRRRPHRAAAPRRAAHPPRGGPGSGTAPPRRPLIGRRAARGRGLRGTRGFNPFPAAAVAPPRGSARVRCAPGAGEARRPRPPRPPRAVQPRESGPPSPSAGSAPTSPGQAASSARASRRAAVGAGGSPRP